MKPLLHFLLFTLTISIGLAQESRVLVQNSKGTTSDNSTLNANWSDAYEGRADMENTISVPERSTIVFLFYSITSQAGKSLDNVLSKAEYLAKKIDKALKSINGNTKLLSYWKVNGGLIKNKVYPNVGHKAWDVTKKSIQESNNATQMKILQAIEDGAPPTNSQVAMAGAYAPELGGNVVLRYNDKNFDVKLLEPELIEHLDYVTMIKNDFDNGGKVYKRLYSNVSAEKIQNAGIAGTHAEVLATNEVIKQLKRAGMFKSLKDIDKIHILVKGRAAFGNMCRCPHCFQIIDGVKMIGNQ